MARRAAVAVVLLSVVAACGGGSGSGGDRADCAAARLEPDLDPDPTLPDAVAETEVAILRAAVACDADRLEALADFDLDEPRVTTLVELFDGPVVLDGDTYIWPGTEENGPRTSIAADGTWLSYGNGENAAANVLAATYDGRLLLLATDGTQRRELGTIAPDDASNGFAVSPNGRFAYFDRGGLPACDAKIVRLDLKRGRERMVATGSQPALSPDGRRLVYVACREGSNFPDQVVIRTVRSGKERTDDEDAILANPSWAPDSKHLAVQLPDPGTEIRVLDLGDDEPLANATVVELESIDNTFWAGYRGSTGEFYALTAPGGEAGAGSPLQVIAIDAETGATLGPLFTVDGQCCDVHLAADRAGTLVLVAGAANGLVVWREGGSPQPFAGGEDVRRAAWVTAS